MKSKSDIPGRCYKFSLGVIRLCDKLVDSKLTNILSSQLIRSSTSIGANVIEAQAASSRKEYKKYFEIALKSSNETIYWLYLIRDTKLISTDLIGPIIEEARQISLILGKSVISLKKL
jgi:four helix bundle protein